jgi:hypothetical protein
MMTKPCGIVRLIGHIRLPIFVDGLDVEELEEILRANLLKRQNPFGLEGVLGNFLAGPESQ